MFKHRKRFEIDEARHDAVVAANVALATTLDDDARVRLRRLSAGLAESKHWQAVGAMQLSDEIVITIAANAAIPILNLDPWLYRQVHTIVVFPTHRTTHAVRAGPAAGVVTDEPTEIIGQALPQTGPITLAWDAVLASSRNPAAGSNVVIHEFAHKIDMADGYTDGAPPLRRAELERWLQMVDNERTRPVARSTPDPLHPYAWANPAEFFAVATEAFFCTSSSLAAARPDLYGMLRSFYRQDPAVPQS